MSWFDILNIDVISCIVSKISYPDSINIRRIGIKLDYDSILRIAYPGLYKIATIGRNNDISLENYNLELIYKEYDILLYTRESDIISPLSKDTPLTAAFTSPEVIMDIIIFNDDHFSELFMEFIYSYQLNTYGGRKEINRFKTYFPYRTNLNSVLATLEYEDTIEDLIEMHSYDGKYIYPPLCNLYILCLKYPDKVGSYMGFIKTVEDGISTGRYDDADSDPYNTKTILDKIKKIMS